VNTRHVVADFLYPVSGTVHANEPLHRIRQRARAGGFASIIVVDQNRPVGLIRWSEIDRVTTIPETSLARDIMLADGPALTRRTPVLEAQVNLDLTGMDRLPVVDNDGMLIGVFATTTVKETAQMEHDNTDQAMHDSLEDGMGRQAFTVYPGMEVYASDGDRVGLVDRLFLESGTVVGFLVAYSEDDPRHKYLGVDVVEELFNETVILSIAAAAFKRLPDAAPGTA
jgi:hypothetical protein